MLEYTVGYLKFSKRDSALFPKCMGTVSFISMDTCLGYNGKNPRPTTCNKEQTGQMLKQHVFIKGLSN